MAKRPIVKGPTGQAVRENLANVRHLRRMTLRDVSERLAENGWPKSEDTVWHMEQGDRRIDVDDLVALAAVLDVSVLQLLGIAEPPTSLDDRVARIEAAMGLTDT
jgi:transcriptional regulator with XRE-family HTH domain